MSRQWLLVLHTHLPLAAFISLEMLRNALSTLGYPAVALFIMIESMGIPFPGETMLLLASFYAAVDQKLQIPLVIVCTAVGAILGDNIGYLIGRSGGYVLVQRFGHYIFLKPEHLQRTEHFFVKHGDKTVFFGRFVAVLRAWAAFLAGVNRMPWPTFLLYNAAGGIIWSIVYGCLGFYAGHFFKKNFGAVEQIAKTISWGGAALIVVVVIIIYILFRVRRKHKKLEERGEEATTKVDITLLEAASSPNTPTTLMRQEQTALEAQGEQNPASLTDTQTPIASPEETPTSEAHETETVSPDCPQQAILKQEQDKVAKSQQEAISSPESK